MMVEVLIHAAPVIHTVGVPETDRFVTHDVMHPVADPPIFNVPVALPNKLNVATLLTLTVPPKTEDVPVINDPPEVLIFEFVEA
jgi:hypothetical protein